MNLVKKENLCRKFSDNVKRSSKKLLKMLSADIKVDVKQHNMKEMVHSCIL